MPERSAGKDVIAISVDLPLPSSLSEKQPRCLGTSVEDKCTRANKTSRTWRPRYSWLKRECPCQPSTSTQQCMGRFYLEYVLHNLATAPSSPLFPLLSLACNVPLPQPHTNAIYIRWCLLLTPISTHSPPPPPQSRIFDIILYVGSSRWYTALILLNCNITRRMLLYTCQNIQLTGSNGPKGQMTIWESIQQMVQCCRLDQVT